MIKIDENFSVEQIPDNWVLRYKGEPCIKEVRGKPMEVTPKEKWYYSNLKTCLKSYVDKCLHYSKCENLTEVLTRLDEIESNIKNIK